MQAEIVIVWNIFLVLVSFDIIQGVGERESKSKQKSTWRSNLWYQLLRNRRSSCNLSYLKWARTQWHLVKSIMRCLLHHGDLPDLFQQY